MSIPGQKCSLLHRSLRQRGRIAAALACLIYVATGCADRGSDHPRADPRAPENTALPAPTDNANSVIDRADARGTMESPQLDDGLQPGATTPPDPLPERVGRDPKPDAGPGTGNPLPTTSEPVAPVADADSTEPSAADAAAVLREYYAAINARDYPRAHRLWSDNGAASGQTTLQFADGFTQTQNVSVEIGAPSDQEAGAGQRYLRIPITLTATHRDGSVRRFTGSYVMHRTVVDGASPEQRSWRIRSAELREVSR